MPEENSYKKALGLLMSGRRKEASTELLRLYHYITDNSLRLQLIDALLTALDPKKENHTLIDLSSEGIKLSEEQKSLDLRAHFMSRKAEFLANKSAFLHLRRAELKLAPGWLGFSIEADKNNYESLTAEIQSLEKETDKLLSDAMMIATSAGNKKTLAFVLISKGYVESSRYLDYKLKCISVPWKSKVRLILNKWGLEIPLLFGLNHHKRLKAYIESFTKSYLEGAKLLEEIDDPYAGYAFRDLSISLKMAYKFRQAKSCLRKAKVLARKHNDAFLSAQISQLERSIKARNRDVPNYLNGETRRDWD